MKIFTLHLQIAAFLSSNDLQKKLPTAFAARLLMMLFVCLGAINSSAQSYLGLDGGFEGTATIDNTNTFSAPQANKWTKANNTTQTISNETTTIRSGANSLRLNNTSTSGQRAWSPLISTSSTTNSITLQYWRFVANTTNCNENQDGIYTSAETLNAGYATGTAGTWTKVTYTKSSSTYASVAGIIMHRAKGTGGNMFIDDVVIYPGAVDVTAPNSPGTVTITQNGANPTTKLDVSWLAASGGVDNGGYIVVRYASAPVAADDPNVNGIYATNNSIAVTNTGTVVYVGTSLSFTDDNNGSGLTPGTTYYYKVYTYDKAYNYSAEFASTGTSGNTACAAPTTQALNITFASIGSGSMNVNWTNGNGAGRVVKMNTSNSFTAPTDGSNPSANTTYGGSGEQVVFNGTGSGPVSISGLSGSTTYWYRVYEYCSADRTYQTATATNNPKSQATICAAPTTQALNITFASVGATSMDVNWTNGSGTGRIIKMNTSNSFTAPADGSNPTANSTYGGSGEQVVFNGTGSGPVSILGLSASTTYWYRVYEYCSTDRTYQTATATNNPNSQATTSGSSPAASITGSVAEQNLPGYGLAITLTNETFSTVTPATTDFTLNNAPPGLTISSVTYTNNTNVTLNLAYSGDFDANVTNFNVTISGSILTSTSNLTSNNITLTALVESITVGTVTGFGNVAVNTTSAEKNFNISGTLRANVNLVPPTGFEISTGTGGSFVATNPIILSPSGTTLASTPIYIRFKPVAVTSYSGNITASSNAATDATVALTGTGVAPSNPGTFTATAASASQINLASSANTNNNNIVVVYNATGTFTTPTDGNAAGAQGASFAGGIIWYNGSAGSITNHTGLSSNTQYFYKAFSYDAQNFFSAGLTANATTAKAEPTAQPTGLGFNTIATTSFITAFTAASPAADGYIVIRSTSNSLGANPADGTTYTVGNSLGGGTVVSVGSTISGITNTSLTAGTIYYTFVFAYNNSGSLIDYLTTGPLTGNTITLCAAPAPSSSNVTAVSFDISWSAVGGAASYQLDVATDAGFTAILGGYNGITATSPTSVTGLAANTPYYYRVRAVNASGNSAYGSGNVTTSGLVAPVATAGTGITTTGFTANWGSVSGATSYRLDVATNSNFVSPTFTNLVSWDFPNNPDDAIADGGIAANNAKTLTVNGGVSGLVFNAAGATTNSANSSNWQSGSGTKYWEVDFVTLGYYNTRISSKQRGSNTGPRDFKLQYKIGVSGTYTDVPTTSITVANDYVTGVLNQVALPSACDNQSSVYLRWVMTSNTSVNNSTVASGGGANIDDILVEGNASAYVPGYQDLTVNATFQSVTGLNTGTTYYYRVRSFATNSTSSNSNVISVTTIADPNNADYRSVTSGNYSNPAIWEYSNGDGSYTAATAAPTSGSNVNILAAHTVTLDNNFSVGSGKTVTVDGTMIFGTNVLSGAGAVTVNNGATIKVGSLSGAGAVNGNIAVSGAVTLNTGSTVEYNGAGAQTMAARTFSILTINNASGVNLSGNVVVNGAFTLSAGVLAVGTNTLTLNSTVSATSGSLSSATTGTVSYAQGSGGQAVLAASYGNLSFSNFSKTLPPAVVGIAGTFTAGSGTPTITNNTINFNGSAQTVPAFSYNNLDLTGATGTTFASGTVNIAGVFTPASIASASAGTIVFNGSSAQTVPAFIYNSLTASNAAGSTTSGAVGIGGVLTVSQNLTVGNSSTLTLNSTTTAVTVASTKSLIVNATATLQNNSAATFTLTGTMTVNGNYVHNANSNTIPAATYAANSNLKVGDGGSNVTSTLPVLPATIGGNVIWNTPNGSFSATAFIPTTASIGGNLTIISTGTALFNGSGGTARTLTVGGNLEVQGGIYNVINNGTGSATASQITNVTGSVLITGGTLLVSGNTSSTGIGTLNIGGNFTHSAGTFGNTTSSTTGTVNFNGGGSQVLEDIGQTGNVVFNITQTTGTGVASVAPSKSFVLTNASTFTINDNTSVAGSELTINGTFKNQSTATTPVTINASAIATTANGGTYQHDRDGGAVPAFAFATGSTINVTGIVATNVLIANAAYHVIWNSPAQTTGANFLAAATINLGGNLTVISTGTGGITNGTGATARTLNIAGNLVVNGGSYNILGNNAASNQIQTTIVAGDYTQTGGQVIIAAGSAVGTGILTVNGTTTVNGTATLNISSTATGAGGVFNIKGNLVHTAGIIGKTGITTGLINFNGTTAQTLSTTGFTNAIDVTVANSNGVSLLSNCTIGGTLTLTTGAFTVGSNTLTLNGPTIAGTPTNLSTSSASSLSFGGISSFVTIPSNVTALNNLTVNNVNGVSLGSSPVISGTLTLTSGALSIGANTLTLNGLVSYSTGTLTGSSTSNLTIGGSALAQNLKFTPGAQVLKNLTLSNGATAVLGTSLDIATGASNASGIVTVNLNATLTTGGNLTIKSDANGTASIGNSAGTISGDVTVERWIPQRKGLANGGRAYRLLTPTVSGGSINANWQEGGQVLTVGAVSNPLANYGTHITGNSVTSSKLDITQNNQASLYTTGFGPGPDLPYTAVTDATANLDATKGYFLYIRGDRSVSLQEPYNPAGGMPTTSTTLKAKGSVHQGSVGYTISSTPGEFSMVTNPFASVIDWQAVYNGNNTKIADSYIMWDPNIGTEGGFVTVAYNGTATPSIPDPTAAGRYIQPGQAFMVQTVSGSTISITEAMKVPGNNNNGIFRMTPFESFQAELYLTEANNVRHSADGVMVKYNNSYSTGNDGADFNELANWNENIAVKRMGRQMAVEGRPVIVDRDTIPLFVESLRQTNYEWVFTPSMFTNIGLKAELIDNFLNTRTLLSVIDSVVVPFTVTSNPASSAANRFMVVFGPFSPLAIDVITIKAQAKNNGVQVDWTSKTEQDMNRYELERSFNGTSFSNIKTTAAVGNSPVAVNYGWLDASPQAGTNFYRIKAIDNAGLVKYTNIVRVDFGKTNPTITVSPNPVTGSSLNLKLSDLPKGSYTVQLFNSIGQQVLVSRFNHPGGSVNQPVNLTAGMALGTYQLLLNGGETRFRTTIIKN